MSYNPNNPNGSTTAANSAPVTVATDNNLAKETGGNLATLVTNTTSIATSALQTTGNTSLSTIATNTGNGATSANQTNGTQQTKLTDGTNVATVKAASTAAAATDKAVVVAVSPNNTVPVSLATAPTTPVTGTFWQATQPVSLATNTPTIAAGSAIIGKVGIDQTTVGTTNAVSIAQLGANTIATGNGTSSTGTLRVALASDQTTNTNPLLVKQQAQTTGGATPYQLISAATTNATSVKASAGTVYGIQVYNTGAAVAFLKIYNKASAPTVGTDTPVKTIGIPAAGGSNLPITDIGIALGTGIAFAITGLNTVADTTAVAANQVTVNIDYV